MAGTARPTTTKTTTTRTTRSPVATDELRVEALGPDTWAAYAALMERHNGVFGGCWCTYFHTMAGEKTYDADSNRALKERLVHCDRAHAAVVLHGDEAVAWCQYGPPDELPNIYHRKQYEETSERLPDFRITCLFVDKRYRRSGVSAIALQGVLDLVAAAGGGVVEGYPHDNDGKKMSVLYNGTRALFERAGFTYDRPKGAKNCVMTKTVAAAG
ncbi:GNAT family N-acetyltransferase [Phycicoccus sp. Root563]|uniref:GNAT family N-acetyltransferase n=1 Tax=Phycicoccus sp. Root563 TaxID=1736562 RepID=UPI001F3AA0D7|nr:GNAT family N-acetyltransferase [Phycicoccus sp. Root563]